MARLASEQDERNDDMLFLEGKSFNATKKRDESTDVSFIRVVPNSQVPILVRPPDRSLESDVLKMRKDSSTETAEQHIDRDILVKMREFELVGQQLFGVGESKIVSPTK